MIEIVFDNIITSNAEALVNPVNTIGVAGKGLALQFKYAFPKNYEAYVLACMNKEIDIGKLFVFKENEKYIINFPTKKHWKDKSDYEYISLGLDDLIKVIDKYQIKSIAIPALGCGSSGLNWDKVKSIIEEKLGKLDNVLIYLHKPGKYPF